MDDDIFLIVFLIVATLITFCFVVLGNSFDYSDSVKLNGSDLVRNAIMTLGICFLSFVLGCLVTREENTSIPTKKDYLKGDAKMIIEKSLNGEPDTTYQFNKERRNR